MAADTKQLTRTIEGAELPVAGKYTLDQAHTTVGFVVRHLMVSKVRGGFTDFAGTIEIAENPAESHVEVTVQTASIDTRESQRDTHLRSGDFFEVERFPVLTFASTEVARYDDHWRMDGKLTIKDVSRPVSLEVEFNGASQDPWAGTTRVGFSAWTEINREDFGLTWNAALETGGVVVAQKVRIEIEAEAVLEA